MQPEWKHYVKDGKLHRAAYWLAMQNLACPIQQCVANNPGAKVVLSGFGLNNFLKGLTQENQDAARNIGAEVFTSMVRDLRASNVNMAYTDYSGYGQPWEAVNQALGKYNVPYLGQLPGTGWTIRTGK